MRLPAYWTSFACSAGSLSLWLLGCLFAAHVACAADSDPAWYRRQQTWEETLRVSREALLEFEADEDAAVQRQKAADAQLKDFQPQMVELNFGDKPQKVRVRVAGLPRLVIGVKRKHGSLSGILGEPRLIAADGKAVPCTASAPRSTVFPSRGRLSQLTKPVVVGKQAIQQGLVLANQDVCFELDGKYEWFEAWLAVHEGAAGNQLEFHIDWRSRLERAEQRATRRAELWKPLRRDFRSERLGAELAVADPQHIWRDDWQPGDFRNLASRYERHCLGQLQAAARPLAAAARTAQDLEQVRELYRRSGRCRQLQQQCQEVNVEAVGRAIDDLGRSFAGRYDDARQRQALEVFVAQRDSLIKSLAEGQVEALEPAARLLAGVRGALLANPLLDGDRILCVRRNIDEGARSDLRKKIGFISLNSHCHVTIDRSGWDDEIAVLSQLRTEPQLKTLYKPDRDVIVRDLDLDFSGQRLMISSFDENRKWAIYELPSDGSTVRQVSPQAYPDVDWFDACYLPDGRVVLLSTASYQGLPCENGSRPMAQVYQLTPATGQVRQLTFEQDSDYTPSITNDGRILYTRWEYSDLPHYFSRIVMTMNPDGTSQLGRYGSGSYYPTTLLQARTIPNHPDQFVGIVGGHHDVAEIGRLVVFDSSLARRYPFQVRPQDKIWGPENTDLRISVKLPAEQSGCVAEIPGWGKLVEGDVCDTQTGNQFALGKPYFVHPWPLSDKYFLVSAKRPNSLWGIYLVDVFDNITLLAEVEDAALLEPIAFESRRRPPVIPDRIQPQAATATVHIADIYKGPGLKHVARGKVKALRVFAYHFAYVGTGGHASLGVEAGWDLKRILGTVPVEADGSAYFQIPANTPVSLQPLDEEGAALQLMRSWLVGMPGERVSCTGCHEDTRTAIPTSRGLADQRPLSKLQPWYGEPRPFAFEFEVYPVLQKFCVGCHSGDQAPLRGWDQGGNGKQARLTMKDAREAYDLIHPYVRRPGPESELVMLEPMEYHASTSPLVQMLKKGHHGVQLDAEAWQRLYAWIDLNVTFKGNWGPGNYQGQPQKDRRQELAQQFAGTRVCPEDEYDRVQAELKSRPSPEFVPPAAESRPTADQLRAPSFPLSPQRATAAQRALGATRKTVTLPGGLTMDFVRIPAGAFVMGSLEGAADEYPRATVSLTRPFWMAESEVTNAQYRQFDPEHDTRYIDAHGKDHNCPGYIANHDQQPVARVPWFRAAEFCRWLGGQAKLPVQLPTEAQWEWAARAGTAGRFFYGGLDDDFSPWANLADRSVRWNNVGFTGARVQVRNPYPPEKNFPLHEERFEDKWFIVDFVGQYAAHPWGLKDIIGNVSEWTRSSYRPYPYDDQDGRNEGSQAERKVARGGSWHSRPREAGSAVRLPYESYQPVHDVGFRVIIDD